MRRPEPRGVRPGAVDDDQHAWLVTFSDLVLQLFGFVVLALAASRAATAPAGPPVAPAAPPPAAVALDAAEVRAAAAMVDAAAAAPAEPSTDAAPPADGGAPPPAPPRRDATASLDAQLAALVAAHPAGDGLRATVRDSSVVFTLEDGIAFASGSAELLPGAAPLLAEIRRLAASLPDFTVEVAGHTDDVPIRTAAYPSNLELSLARAARVAREIAGADPALRARTVARGWGEFRPLTPNVDAAARARNRRVEIRLVPADAG